MSRKPAKLLQILLLIALCACSKTEPPIIKQQVVQPPLWYESRSVTGREFEIIGYGEGNTQQEATSNARANIAKQIQVRVKSQFDQKTERKKLKGTVDSQKSELHYSIHEVSEVELDGLKVIVEQRVESRFYVALKYVHLPLAEKIKYELEQTDEPPCLKTGNPAYMTQTPLFIKLKAALNCEPAIGLVHKNGIWYVHVNSVMVRLLKAELTELWAGMDNEAVGLKSTASMLDKGDLFHFTIQANKRGYLSLFNVYNTGQTVLLLPGEQIKAGEKIVYPDLKKWDGLTADLLPGQEEAKDLYLAALCSDKRNFSRYEPIDDDKLAGANTFQFGDLLRDLNGCDISAKIIHVKKAN
ncbi:LPP20 family lipoprotein [bacterium]|nr:LPP20 family lipoprotein [bacterium]